jgi:hypothetical protein
MMRLGSNHEKPTGLYFVCHEGKDGNAIVKQGDDLTLDKAVRLFVNTEAIECPVAIYAKMHIGSRRTHYVKVPPPVHRRNPPNREPPPYNPPKPEAVKKVAVSVQPKAVEAPQKEPGLFDDMILVTDYDENEYEPRLRTYRRK